MLKSKLTTVLTTAFTVLCVTGNVWAASRTTYPYDAGNHENKTFNDLSGRKAHIEVYAIGGGGGGQGGHGTKYKKDLFNDYVYYGTGGAGGGGGGAYMKFKVTGPCILNINVGGGGSCGYSRWRGLGDAWWSGMEGQWGAGTVVTWGSVTLIAGGGQPGGWNQPGSAPYQGLGGGSGGGASISNAHLLIDHKLLGGDQGSGGHQGNETANSKGNASYAIASTGGGAPSLYIGSTHLSGGNGGSYNNVGGYPGGGGSGGFGYGDQSGGKGGGGTARVIVTYLYDVTFNSNGGSAVASYIDVEDNEKIGRPSDPKRDGYNFSGWWTAQIGGSEWNFTSNTVTANTTLYAHWTPIIYGISYNPNSGTNPNPPNPSNYTIETPTITFRPATREHYTFGGWFPTSALTGTPVTSIPLGSTGDKTFWAKWDTIRYAVTFDLNGGNAPTPPNQTVNSGNFASEPNKPTRTGNQFVGWFVNLDDENSWLFRNNTVTGDITLHAKWFMGDVVRFPDKAYVYDGTEKKLETVELERLIQNDVVTLHENVDFSVEYEDNKNSGTASATITGINAYEYLGTAKTKFTIQKRPISVTWQNTILTWNGKQQAPTPVSSETKFAVAVKSGQGTDVGFYTARAMPVDDNITLIAGEEESYRINPKEISVTWGNIAFTWNGELQAPTPISSDPNFPVKATLYVESINVNNTYLADAVLVTPNNNISLTGGRTSYSIGEKVIDVKWENTGPFVYNKMVQTPTAKIKTGEEKYDTIALSVSNQQSQVGIYTGQKAPIAEIIDQNIAKNIILNNRTISYEIKKKPLYIALTKEKSDDDFTYNEREITDSIQIVKGDIKNIGHVLDSLKKIIGYDGFARDTITNETDNESVLSGEPKFEMSKTQNSQRSLRGEGLSITELIENGEYLVSVKISDIIAQNYILNEGQITVKVSDSLVSFTVIDNRGTPVIKPQKSDKKHGIILEKSIVSDKAVMRVELPNKDDILQVKLVIYDNIGNVVFERTQNNANVTWNLTNSAGRNVANGTYLIVAEVKGGSGKTYAYSAKLGVKR